MMNSNGTAPDEERILRLSASLPVAPPLHPWAGTMGKGGGGHGGLNILPQKSWNVYGPAQRQRVRDAEEKAAAEEAAEEAARHDARRESNLVALRERASKRRRDDELELELDDAEARLPTEHINFFAEEERELEKLAVEEARARARPRDGPNEDARLGGFNREDRPWYSRAERSFHDADERRGLGESLPAKVRREREEREALLERRGGGVTEKKRSSRGENDGDGARQRCDRGERWSARSIDAERSSSSFLSPHAAVWRERERSSSQSRDPARRP